MNAPRRGRSRSPDNSAEGPLLRRRISRVSVPFEDSADASERRGGLTQEEWTQLYERVLPNPISKNEFQRVMLEGKLHDHFLAKDLHKLVMELRAILESHGELRMADKLAVKGRKQDLAEAVATSLRLLELKRRHPLSEDILATGGMERVQSPRVMLAANPERITVRPSTSQTLKFCYPTTSYGLLGVSQTQGHRFGTQLTFNDSIRTSVDENINGSSSFLTSVTKDEISLMNESSSPFTRVLNVVSRFQLRFGSIPIMFEIPVQYVDSVVSRRLRVQLAPFRNPAIPTRWPTAKDIAVYVNDQCVTTPWKRSWPERRVEVAKTFLPLDVTQFLNRNSTTQRMQINVFSREFFSQVALMIVQPVSVDEVINNLVKPLSGLQDSRDAAIYELYRTAVEDEDGLMGEVEIDDPVITSKCPILQTRMNIPIRGISCKHLQCFDCQSFLLSCHKGSYWNCPLCDAELRPRDVVVDTVLWRYLQETGNNCPLHLRLMSTRTVENTKSDGGDVIKTKEGSKSVTFSFRWVPNRHTGGANDVLVEDDSDESKEEENNFQPCFQEVLKGQNLGEKEPETAAGNVMHDVQLGTADCPIEL
ncbi:zinc finger protein, predicted [Trypanosoma theileri]|uniref:Zinc finger protein, predicted n=1 Tax=Trypanosoma theileri TaxID=67003 RepID=A0A1X0P542_9TRYP|nr:zinc finger protein, predicted [Trypanosoma theileri]ORC92064.1 zinc finger protein, predicted [Trypanosoma theileri]